MAALLRIDKGEEKAITPTELATAPLCILKVTAPWCGPCKRIHPEFVGHCMNNERITGCVLDVELAQSEAGEALQFYEQLNIEAFPTFIALVQGQELKRFKGASAMGLEALFRDTTQAASAPTTVSSES